MHVYLELVRRSATGPAHTLLARHRPRFAGTAANAAPLPHAQVSRPECLWMATVRPCRPIRCQHMSAHQQAAERSTPRALEGTSYEWCFHCSKAVAPELAVTPTNQKTPFCHEREAHVRSHNCPQALASSNSLLS